MENLAEQPLQNQKEQLDEYTRHRNDTVTWLAESLHGNMRTSFDYRFDGQELYAEDGGAMGEVFTSAITAAKDIVQLNPNLLFELRRRLIEHGEYQDMLAMSRGEMPNTMIVVSDFPLELMETEDDTGGYNIGRKQTMLRIIVRQPDGTIRMTTQSLDGSNRLALEAIYRQMGEVPQAGELLGQRMYRDLPEDWQGHLVNNLCETYDGTLASQFGGSWEAGIEQVEDYFTDNTADFVMSQSDLIEWFVEAKLSDVTTAENLRYGLAATMEARYKESLKFEAMVMSATVNLQAVSPEYLSLEIERAKQLAIQKGTTYSGCGVTIKMNEVDGQLQESGYGNKTKPDSKYNFDKKMHCVVCQAPPKNGESKKPCGPCGICRSCDRKLGGKG